MGTIQQLRGKAMRVTGLDQCGAVLPSARGSVVTKGFVSVSLSPNLNEGTRLTRTNANGDNMVDEQPRARFQNWGVSIAFIGVDPELFALMTGDKVYRDASGKIVGRMGTDDVEVDLVNWALEVWTDIPAEACGAGEGKQFGYFLLPWLGNGVLGEITFQNDVVDFSVTNVTSQSGNAWGKGPYDVVADAQGLPPPLATAVPPSLHDLNILTSIAPPAVTNGPVPVGDEATQFTAGSPATATPADGYAPYSLTEIIASDVVASPTAAWGAGQYVLLGDGTKATWDGDSWVAA